jgi:hypothetical protein
MFLPNRAGTLQLDVPGGEVKWGFAAGRHGAAD